MTRHFVRLFKPRFAPLVEAGLKRQTVRPTPKRIPKAGDTLSLRTWTGKPYRSKQRELKLAMCIGCVPVTIDRFELVMPSGTFTDRPHLDAFSEADGFDTWQDLCNWFAQEHGLPFAGILISW